MLIAFGIDKPWRAGDECVLSIIQNTNDVRTRKYIN